MAPAWSSFVRDWSAAGSIAHIASSLTFDLQALYYTAVFISEMFSPFTEDPITAPNAVYDVVEKCSNDPITADNPVYGVRIDVTT